MTAGANADSPKDQLETTINRMLALVESKSYGEQGPAERQAAARKILDELFDWPEMARRALGQHWLERTPAEQQDFVGLFANLLGRAYAAKLENAGAAKVDYVSQAVDGEGAIVRTQLIVESDEDVSVDYRLTLRDGRWKVVDIIFDDVGMVGNYRAQFRRVLGRSSYAELVTRIKEQLKLK